MNKSKLSALNKQQYKVTKSNEIIRKAKNGMCKCFNKQVETSVLKH